MNYYDRLNQYVPPIIAKKGDGGVGTTIDIYTAKLEYSLWMQDILQRIESIEGISKNKKDEIIAIVNAKAK